MKRKRFDRDIWTSISRKRYRQQIFASDDTIHIAALLHIDQVNSPSVWHIEDEEIAVCAEGMKWLQLLPAQGNYLITAMISSDDHINVWYIDVIAGHDMDMDNVAVFNDLYLDYIITPSGKIKLDDMDELEDALRRGLISQQLYRNALQTACDLEATLLADLDALTVLCHKYLSLMEKVDHKK